VSKSASIAESFLTVCRYKVYWKNQGLSDASWLSERHLLGAEIVLAEWQAEKRRRIMERRKRYSQTGVPISLFGGHGM
jgi:histone-lysine N-methyltransferase SUV39H